MTVKKTARTGGFAAIVARQKLTNANQQFDANSIAKPISQNFNIIVGFNEKDQLQLLTKEDTKDEDKQKLIHDYTDFKTNKQEIFTIDDVTNCVNVENYSNCENTLVFYVFKNNIKEAIVVKFENEQDFKRIYFTYKYFKMRNRLTNNSINHSNNESLFSKKKTYDLFQNRKSSIDDYSLLDQERSDISFTRSIDTEGIPQLSVHQKNLISRFDQPISLIGVRNGFNDVGEIDSVIYTDVDIPTKPERKRLFHTKPKAPQPPSIPSNKESQTKVLKGEFIRVNVEKVPDVILKDNKFNKMPDLLIFKEKGKKNNAVSNLWTASNKVTGYESDREEWRSSRSQFSTTAFDSLTRPTKMAMALTLRKPQRLDPMPTYYRLSNEQKAKLTPLPFRPNNFLQRPPTLSRPPIEIKRNLSAEHRKYTSLQNLDIPKKLSEPKKTNETKKANQSNLSHRITGLTNKLRDLGNPSNTIGRFKAQSHSDVANLKPVLKTNGQDGAKRPVVRTCSIEPPKKVTFSAFATVQVV